jgi:hypothetical protein
VFVSEFRGREIWRLRVADGQTEVLSRCGS